ncbi:MAG: signal transduction histidine kinase, partial [Marivirga sp.]
DLARTYSTIGWNYIFQENYNKATEYGERSLKLVLEIGDSAGISKSQNLIGFALLKTRKYTKALNCFESALTIRRQLGLRWGETYTIYNKALVYYELEQYDTAFDLLYEALALAKEINNKSAYVYINNQLGLLYAKTKEYALAERYLQDAQIVAKEVPLASELLTNYKNYIALFEARKDTRNSLAYYRLYTSLKDSADHDISSGRIANADALFQVQKKTAELQTKIEENLVQKEKIGEQTELIQVQKRILIIVSISLFLLTTLLAAIVRLLLSRSRAKEKLRIQNLDIQEQKEEIQTQSEELVEANQHLETLIETLSEKNAEIEAQSDLLSTTNNNLEMQVADRTTKLSAAYSELETFFYKASHDFRRPLTTYFGLVEVAKSILKDKQALELFEKVRLTTMGLDKMIFKLQSIGNIDYKNESIHFSISNLISDCIHSNKKLIAAKGINILTPDETISIYNNYSLFKIVIFNLIENALLFSHPSKPQIQIHWTTTEKEVSIAIEDNGSGILESVQPRIFDMFFRGNEASQGNGLGLYVTKRAIDKLEGNITFTSTVNKGSTFKITVPTSTNP